MLLVRDLRPGERLLIDRRRRGETRSEAAQRFGVSLSRYARWEGLGRGLSDTGPEPALGRLEPWEAAFLLRRRARVGVLETALALGVSPWRVEQTEAGVAGGGALLAAWASAGWDARVFRRAVRRVASARGGAPVRGVPR